MNKEWSLLCSSFQKNISKQKSFKDGVNELLELRKQMFDMVMMVYHSFPKEGYSKQPFINAKGYESKTMAYSLFHICRIEDIVVNSIINKKTQVLYLGNYDKSFPLFTTGNELVKDEIREFSEKLDIDVLHNYIKEVYENTNKYLKILRYEDLKYKPEASDVEDTLHKGWVSENPLAIWLIDYWKTKDVLGFIKMPLSRHWIMHVEAFLRIKNKLSKKI